MAQGIACPAIYEASLFLVSVAGSAVNDSKGEKTTPSLLRTGIGDVEKAICQGDMERDDQPPPGLSGPTGLGTDGLSTEGWTILQSNALFQNCTVSGDSRQLPSQPKRKIVFENHKTEKHPRPDHGRSSPDTMNHTVQTFFTPAGTDRPPNYEMLKEEHEVAALGAPHNPAPPTSTVIHI
ncbi:hypothetical protein P7K49_027439 [Saguinus oedipus]|uniref:Uncharacterized protein n=1 Tax=Saguinus oedipus TaxID=9490 RepID=A0ABQ9U9G7_SAGOE|nr:hypothetical protein P7K49_027439 [Saguinus oedipus]